MAFPAVLALTHPMRETLRQDRAVCFFPLSTHQSTSIISESFFALTDGIGGIGQIMDGCPHFPVIVDPIHLSIPKGALR